MPDEENVWTAEAVADLELAEAVGDIRDWLSGEVMYVDWRKALPLVLAEYDRLRATAAAPEESP